MAETFFAVRAAPARRLKSVGSAFSGTYVADKGFEGVENHRRWLECYGAEVLHPPKRNSKKRSWSKRLRRWIASIRQIVETVYDKLFNTFMRFALEPDLEVVGEAGDAAEAISLARDLHPDVILMDVEISGNGGIVAIERLRTAAPHSAVVIFTLRDDAATREQARGAERRRSSPSTGPRRCSWRRSEERLLIAAEEPACDAGRT